MKYLLLSITIIFAILLINACDKNDEGSYSYCVSCPSISPGDSIECFNSKEYALLYIDSKSYLPDSNSCKLISN